jgi:hypothetical protein
MFRRAWDRNGLSLMHPNDMTNQDILRYTKAFTNIMV